MTSFLAVPAWVAPGSLASVFHVYGLLGDWGRAQVDYSMWVLVNRNDRIYLSAIILASVLSVIVGIEPAKWLAFMLAALLAVAWIGDRRR